MKSYLFILEKSQNTTFKIPMSFGKVLLFVHSYISTSVRAIYTLILRLAHNRVAITT